MPPAPKTQPKPIEAPKKQGPPLYLVTFRGQYLNGNTEGGRSGFVNYETTVMMEEDMVEFNAQSIFAGVLAPIIMPQRFPDYRSLSTFNVVKTVREDGKPITNIKLLNRAELENLITREKLPINRGIYKDDEDLRQAILECAKDRQRFLHSQKKKEPSLIERDKFTSRALALNTITSTDDKEDANKTVNNQPTLDQVLDAERIAKEREKLRKQNKDLPAYDTPDIDKDHKAYSGGAQIMTDKLDQDEFPDGRHTVDGEPVNIGF